jgi:hypothetical protein
VAGSVSRQCTCESDGIYGCISKETGPVAELAATLRHRRRTFVAWDELLASRQAKIALWTSCGEREKLTEVLGSVAERTLSWLALVVGSSLLRGVFWRDKSCWGNESSDRCHTNFFLLGAFLDGLPPMTLCWLV